MQSNFAQCTRLSLSRRRLTHMLSVGERVHSVGSRQEAGGSWEGGDVRVQRMFLGVVGKSRKMPGITKNTRDNTLADVGAGSWELLVRPDPPIPRKQQTTSKCRARQTQRAAKTINEKTNKQREMRSEKNKCKYTVRGRGGSRIGGSGDRTARSFVVASFGATRGCKYCHYLFLCPKTFHFHFHLAKGVNWN